MCGFHRSLMLALAIGLLGAMPAAAQEKKDPAYPETADGLKSQIADLYRATKDGDKKKGAELAKALSLPKHEAWFQEIFGEEKGTKLAADYGKQLPKLEGDIGQLFAKAVKAEQSEFQVLRFEKAPDPKAVGAQNDALAAMKKPVPLYSVRFVKPGEKLGVHIYSFAYADGGFRLVGKLQGLRN